jgi:hypothetical protein
MSLWIGSVIRRAWIGISRDKGGRFVMIDDIGIWKQKARIGSRRRELSRKLFPE